MMHSGPFYVADCRHQKGGQIRIFGRPGLGLVANVLRSGPDPVADARLFETAPKMLNALKLFASQCPLSAETQNEGFGFRKGVPLAQIARGVIAEAEGESPRSPAMAPDVFEDVVTALAWAMDTIGRAPNLVRGQNDAYVAEYRKAAAALARGQGL